MWGSCRAYAPLCLFDDRKRHVAMIRSSFLRYAELGMFQTPNFRATDKLVKFVAEAVSSSAIEKESALVVPRRFSASCFMAINAWVLGGIEGGWDSWERWVGPVQGKLREYYRNKVLYKLDTSVFMVAHVYMCRFSTVTLQYSDHRGLVCLPHLGATFSRVYSGMQSKRKCTKL